MSKKLEDHIMGAIRARGSEHAMMLEKLERESDAEFSRIVDRAGTKAMGSGKIERFEKSYQMQAFLWLAAELFMAELESLYRLEYFARESTAITFLEEKTGWKSKAILEDEEERSKTDLVGHYLSGLNPDVALNLAAQRPSAKKRMATV